MSSDIVAVTVVATDYGSVAVKIIRDGRGERVYKSWPWFSSERRWRHLQRGYAMQKATITRLSNERRAREKKHQGEMAARVRAVDGVTE